MDLFDCIFEIHLYSFYDERLARGVWISSVISWNGVLTGVLIGHTCQVCEYPVDYNVATFVDSLEEDPVDYINLGTFDDRLEEKPVDYNFATFVDSLEKDPVDYINLATFVDSLEEKPVDDNVATFVGSLEENPVDYNLASFVDSQEEDPCNIC